MKTYDICCPICSTINRHLYLEETDGWMECESCHQVVKILDVPETEKVRIPVYTPHQLAQRFRAAN
ncbi:MAG: translation initiation factor 2 [Clostridiales bacterium]|nr:translation initiation factor 2 [Clostridiales bacterium]